MKNLILLLSLIFSLQLEAQVQPTPPAPPAPPDAPAAPDAPSDKKTDTVKVNLGDTQIMIIDKNKGKEDDDDDDEDDDDDNMKSTDKSNKENVSPVKNKKRKAADVDFLDIDMGLNILLNNKVSDATLANDLENKPFSSWSWTLNFLPTKIYLGSRNLMFMTSLGWRIGELTFKQKIEFEPNKTLVYSKNDLIKRTSFDFHHLQIPMMLYVRSNKLSGLGRVGLGLGGYAGVLVHQEAEVRRDDLRRKVETEEDFGFETFRYGLSARADLGPFKLFANYDLNPVWKDNDFTNLECGLWLDF